MLNSLPSNLPASQSTGTRQCKQKLYWRIGQSATARNVANEQREPNETSVMCSAGVNLKSFGWAVIRLLISDNANACCSGNVLVWHCYLVCNDFLRSLLKALHPCEMPYKVLLNKTRSLTLHQLNTPARNSFATDSRKLGLDIAVTSKVHLRL